MDSQGPTCPVGPAPELGEGRGPVGLWGGGPQQAETGEPCGRRVPLGMEMSSTRGAFSSELRLCLRLVSIDQAISHEAHLPWLFNYAVEELQMEPNGRSARSKRASSQAGEGREASEAASGPSPAKFLRPEAGDEERGLG